MQLSPKSPILSEQEHFTVSEWQLLKVLTLETKDSRGHSDEYFLAVRRRPPDIKAQGKIT